MQRKLLFGIRLRETDCGPSDGFAQHLFVDQHIQVAWEWEDGSGLRSFQERLRHWKVQVHLVCLPEVAQSGATSYL